MAAKTKHYNIELTLDCRNNEDAANVASFLFFSGFMPITDGAVVKVVAKDVDGAALEYLTLAIEDDDRIIGSSFHRTPF